MGINSSSRDSASWWRQCTALGLGALALGAGGRQVAANGLETQTCANDYLKFAAGGGDFSRQARSPLDAALQAASKAVSRGSVTFDATLPRGKHGNMRFGDDTLFVTLKRDTSLKATCDMQGLDAHCAIQLSPPVEVERDTFWTFGGWAETEAAWVDVNLAPSGDYQASWRLEAQQRWLGISAGRMKQDGVLADNLFTSASADAPPSTDGAERDPLDRVLGGRDVDVTGRLWFVPGLRVEGAMGGAAFAAAGISISDGGFAAKVNVRNPAFVWTSQNIPEVLVDKASIRRGDVHVATGALALRTQGAVRFDQTPTMTRVRMERWEMTLDATDVALQAFEYSASSGSVGTRLTGSLACVNGGCTTDGLLMLTVQHLKNADLLLQKQIVLHRTGTEETAVVHTSNHRMALSTTGSGHALSASLAFDGNTLDIGGLFDIRAVTPEKVCVKAKFPNHAMELCGVQLTLSSEPALAYRYDLRNGQTTFNSQVKLAYAATIRGEMFVNVQLDREGRLWVNGDLWNPPVKAVEPPTLYAAACRLPQFGVEGYVRHNDDARYLRAARDASFHGNEAAKCHEKTTLRALERFGIGAYGYCDYSLPYTCSHGAERERARILEEREGPLMYVYEALFQPIYNKKADAQACGLTTEAPVQTRRDAHFGWDGRSWQIQANHPYQHGAVLDAAHHPQALATYQRLVSENGVANLGSDSIGQLWVQNVVHDGGNKIQLGFTQRYLVPLYNERQV